MSDFLLVIPEGWTQLNWETAFNHPLMSPPAVEEWIQSTQYDYLTQLLVESGSLTEGQTVVQAKLIDNAYFLVRLG